MPKYRIKEKSVKVLKFPRSEDGFIGIHLKAGAPIDLTVLDAKSEAIWQKQAGHCGSISPSIRFLGTEAMACIIQVPGTGDFRVVLRNDSCDAITLECEFLLEPVEPKDGGR